MDVHQQGQVSEDYSIPRTLVVVHDDNDDEEDEEDEIEACYVGQHGLVDGDKSH
jgi:hypothetical protein